MAWSESLAFQNLGSTFDGRATESHAEASSLGIVGSCGGRSHLATFSTVVHGRSSGWAFPPGTSLHARLNIPAAATESGETLIVCVSNFGRLATVAVANPGAYSQDEFEERLAVRDAARIYAALDSLEYQVVPEAPLWEAYGGPSALAGLDARHGATWWTPFFDYL